MKKIINTPETFVYDMCHGLALAHPELEFVEQYKVVKKKAVNRNKVQLISGGGSGHEPAHAGFVGKGMLDAAVCGDVFASPSQIQVYNAIKQTKSNKGTLLIIKNYSGDCMNFNNAAQLAKEDIDGLQIDGVLEVELLCLTADDDEPVRAATEAVPFHYTAEAKGITAESIYQMNTGLDQMTAVMTGGDMVEIRAVINIDLLVLQPVKQQVITSVREEPMDVQKLQKMPGIVGYIVQPGDTLWEIAKKFHTTRDTVMAANELPQEEVKPGMRLLLVKEMAQI